MATPSTRSECPGISAGKAMPPAISPTCSPPLSAIPTPACMKTRRSPAQCARAGCRPWAKERGREADERSGRLAQRGRAHRRDTYRARQELRLLHRYHAVQRLQGLPGDRKSGVEGKSVAVRVDLGGRRIINKKKKKKHNK